MDGDQLFWFYRNPQYVDAVERNLQESTKLLESGSVSGQGVKGKLCLPGKEVQRMKPCRLTPNEIAIAHLLEHRK